MPRAVTGVGPFIAPNNHDCKPGDAKASQDATPHEPPHRSPPHSKAQKPKRWPNTKRPLTRKPYAQGPHPRTRGQLKQGFEKRFYLRLTGIIYQVTYTTPFTNFLNGVYIT